MQCSAVQCSHAVMLQQSCAAAQAAACSNEGLQASGAQVLLQLRGARVFFGSTDAAALPLCKLAVTFHSSRVLVQSSPDTEVNVPAKADARLPTVSDSFQVPDGTRYSTGATSPSCLRLCTPAVKCANTS
jgi:hypothetical protein